MKKLITILLFGFLTISCSSDQDNPLTNEPLITEMCVSVFHSGSLFPSQAESKFNFEYNENKKLTKKIGGFMTLSGSTGFGESFTDKIYTSLTYKNNTVTVEDYYSSTEFTISKNTKYFTLNSLNQIDIKEIPTSTNNNYLYRKQFYFYTNGKLTEIKTTFPNMPYDANDPTDYIWTFSEKFYYDTNGNLSKTEYFEQENGINKGEKIVRTFEDYDNSTNPCKRLFLIDDFFYRSLSKNNFRKYTEAHYNNNTLEYTKSSTWAFSYDTNGQIIIN
ncbi:hypothetical protein [Flavobacterium luminosum]|uniref:YD repeat-containing protein n=1 Tax=Flavobacterium luminosum TaxID=2949086 RepID=A0ABT0TSC7_9FLAO|nr:hypothetical protein [Flavobacterium sp. HXWNR70]MCL9809788.1 hypothetical protein [Flavobacterium sp. HXWNR70]